jgi:hypothetical protein
VIKETSNYNFVKVGYARIALDHRPRGANFPHLRKRGCTHVVSLLKEGEHAENRGTWQGMQAQLDLAASSQ